MASTVGTLPSATPKRRTIESAAAATSRTPVPPPALTPSRPITAASVRARQAEEASAAAVFRHKTRRSKTFLKDNEASTALLPQPLPQGIPYVANFTTFDELLRRNILQQPIDAQVHLGTEDVRLIYDAKCVDQNLTPCWDREVRFMELLSSSCRGSFFTLTENGLGRTAAEAIAHILSLDTTYTILDLSGNRLRDDGVACIARLLTVNDTIVHVGLRSNDIGYDGGVALAEALQRNNTVTSLDLGAHSGINRNHLGSRGAAALGEMLKTNSVLCTLSISSNGLGADGMAQLAVGMQDNTVLTSLDLSSNNLGFEGARILSSILETTALEHIQLQRNALTDKGGVHLCTHMLRCLESGMETIESVNLEFNELGENFAKKVATVLLGSSKLKRLKLGGNDLSGGIKAISDALAENRYLVELSLADCHVDEKEGAALGAALVSNKVLRTLDLSKNRLADAGAVPLAEAIRKNKTLLALNLSSNAIGDVGGVALAKAIPFNTTLQELNLRHNSMTTKTGEVMDDELRNNTTLQRIDVTYNDFTYKCYAGIQHTLQRNSAAWTARVVPRLQSEIEALDEKQKELVQVEDDTEIERRIIKERGDQILRRKEEVRTMTDKFRQELHDLEEKFNAAKAQAEAAEEAYRFAEDRNSAEATLLAGKRNNLEHKTTFEKDKRDRILRDVEKLRRQLKAIQDAETDTLRPLLQELAKVEAERNSDKNDSKFQAEQLASLNLKRKQLETQLGLSTQNTSGPPQANKGKALVAAPAKK